MTHHRGEDAGESARRREGVDFLRHGVEQYAQDNGLVVVPDVDFSNVVANPELGREIAAAYDAAPYFDPAAFPAYEAFRYETALQFGFLTSKPEEGGLGVEIKGSSSEPYPDAASMMDDLRYNCRLRVLVSFASDLHLMGPDVNTMFRAVHDAFGHAAAGSDFEPDGEEAAWWLHGHLYSALARQAFTTETRGQQNARLYDGQRGFPLQKFCLLPVWFTMLDTVTLRTTAREDLNPSEQTQNQKEKLQ
jgi:hypothetical protein